MSNSLYPLVRFSAGEWAPTLDNRYDLEEFRGAARRLRNVHATKQGGAERRAGLQWIAQGKINAAGTASISSFRKFQYAPGTTFQLEFCDMGIRFCANGAQVQVTPTSMPNWNSGNSYAAGAFVQVGGIPYYLYNGPLNNSTVSPGTDTTHWTLQAVYEVPAPYSGTGSTAIGTTTVTPFVPPNYWTADVCQVECLAINDVIYIYHPNFPVYKLTRYSNVYTGVANTGWLMQQVTFITPAMLDENATDETIAASATSGSVTLTAARGQAWVTATPYVPGNTVTDNAFSGTTIYSCTFAHTSGTFANDLASGYWVVVTNFTAAHIGSYWQLAYNRPASYVQALAPGVGPNYTLPSVALSSANGYQLPLVGTWEVQTYGTWQGVVAIGVSYDNGLTWQVITSLTSSGDANYSISGQELQGGIYSFSISGTASVASSTPPRVVLTADNQFVYGLVQITAVATAYSATATVIGPALFATTATQYWSEGAWSAYRGYPAAATVFQERVWYGGTSAFPQDVWGTQTDDIENFALFDQSQATYGLHFTLNAAGRGPIRWMAAQTDLFVGLASAEWIMSSGGTTTAITASQIQALEHTVNGSAPFLPGLIIGQAAVYVQRKGRVFLQEKFDIFTTKYQSNELNTTSLHLTNAGVVQFDYQQLFQNQSLIWAVMGDGTLISMTYAMEQKVFAWSGHNTGLDLGDKVISCSVVYGADGQDDECWVTVLRGIGTNNGLGCQLERLYPVDWQTANVGQPQLSDMCYADCASFFTYPVNFNSNSLYGLPLCLVGRTVVASIVPASGSGAWSVRNLLVATSVTPPTTGLAYVTIPNYVPVAGDTVCVGLPINWQIMPMRLDVDPRAGPTPGQTKSIRTLFLRTLNSIGGQWATTGAPPVLGTLSVVNDIQAYPITTSGNAPPTFVANWPQDVPIDVGGLFGFSLDPEFAIQGSDPLPFCLLGLAIKYDLTKTS